MNSKVAIATLCLVSVFSSSTQAKDTKFTVIQVKLDQTTQPKNVFDETKECLNNNTCKGIIDAAFASYGIDSSYVTSAAAVISSKQKPESEDKDFTYKLPKGYVYCRTNVNTVSIVPKTGDRASEMSVKSLADGITVHTWTPKKNLPDGRSWVEANFEILGIKKAMRKSSGKECASIKSHLVLDCKGGEGKNKEKAPCAVAKD